MSRSLGSRFHALRLRVPLPLGPLLTHTAQQVRSGASEKVFASFRGERSGRWSFKPVHPLHHHALLRYSRPLFAAAAAAAPNAAFPPLQNHINQYRAREETHFCPEGGRSREEASIRWDVCVVNRGVLFLYIFPNIRVGVGKGSRIDPV